MSSNAGITVFKYTGQNACFINYDVVITYNRELYMVFETVHLTKRSEPCFCLFGRWEMRQELKHNLQAHHRDQH